MRFGWLVAFMALTLAGAFQCQAPHTQVQRSMAPASALEACRRNTKKEKRQRNQENMRKFKRGPASAPQQRGAGGKKKTLSRKKLTLKEQGVTEKTRENIFMSRYDTPSPFITFF